MLFAVLIVYLGHFVATSEQEMINNSYNSRQEILLSRNYRGSIFSRDGEVLAMTEVNAAQEETRIYPYKNMFSHAVGYSTQGRMGVEALANYYLINTNTSLNNKVANDMAGVKNPGDNVYTTFDVQLQELADDELSIYRGAIVMSEVKTGRILAMVSHPDFDPNEIEDIWDDLLADDSSTVLLNRATQGLYPPGSTFKIMTALEYIRQNPDDFDEYRFSCPGYFKINDSRINCFHGMSHGKVDFRGAMADSCNSSFANMGTMLEREQFMETLEGLLFNRELPLTLNYSQSSIQFNDDMTMDEILQTSIGQGKTLMTPMHLNMITATVANKGVMMKPAFIERVENDEGQIVKEFKPESYKRLMTEEEATYMTELLQAVIEKGTGDKLKDVPYTSAGKTGSAEYNSNKLDSHAWFTGFAPAEDPEVCVTILIEGAGSGSDYSVPIARRLFDAYFREK